MSSSFGNHDFSFLDEFQFDIDNLDDELTYDYIDDSYEYQISLESSSQSSPELTDESMIQLKAGKKRIYIQDQTNMHNVRRRIHRIPRLLKRDVRRTYSLMCINVLNLGDETLINSFFGRYTSPNFIFVHLEHPGHSHKTIIIEGSKAFSASMNTLHLQFPDITMRQTGDTSILRVIDSEIMEIRTPVHLSGHSIIPEIQPLMNGNELSLFNENLQDYSEHCEHIGYMVLLIDERGNINTMSFV